LVLAVFVAVFITGDVSTTFNSITDGSSIAIGRPSTTPPAPPSPAAAGRVLAHGALVECELLVGLLVITCTPP